MQLYMELSECVAQVNMPSLLHFSFFDTQHGHAMGDAKRKTSSVATAAGLKTNRASLSLQLQLARKSTEQHVLRQRLPIPEAVQPAIYGFVDFPVSFCGVPVIKWVGDLAWELLVAADPNHNLPIGFHAPKQSTCHLSLHSIAAL